MGVVTCAVLRQISLSDQLELDPEKPEVRLPCLHANWHGQRAAELVSHGAAAKPLAEQAAAVLPFFFLAGHRVCAHDQLGVLPSSSMQTGSAAGGELAELHAPADCDRLPGEVCGGPAGRSMRSVRTARPPPSCLWYAPTCPGDGTCLQLPSLMPPCHIKV